MAAGDVMGRVQARPVQDRQEDRKGAQPKGLTKTGTAESLPVLISFWPCTSLEVQSAACADLQEGRRPQVSVRLARWVDSYCIGGAVYVLHFLP